MEDCMMGTDPDNVEPASTLKKQRSIRQKLAFGLATVTAFLLLLEGGLRLFTTAPASHRFRQINQIVLFLGTQPSDLIWRAARLEKTLRKYVVVPERPVKFTAGHKPKGSCHLRTLLKEIDQLRDRLSHFDPTVMLADNYVASPQFVAGGDQQ